MIEIDEGQLLPTRLLLRGITKGLSIRTHKGLWPIPRTRLLPELWRRIDWAIAQPDDYRYLPNHDAWEYRDGRMISAQLAARYGLQPGAEGGRRHQ